MTPEFWNDIWISHGLAKYFESLEFPQNYQLPGQFNVDLQKALWSDSQDSKHALVNNELGSPKEVAKIMEKSIYGQKGASILRWIRIIQGQDNFKVYLRRFLTEK